MSSTAFPAPPTPPADRGASVGLAFGLTCAAGFATVLGGLVVFHRRLVHLANPLSLAIALGVSAGVMLFISLVEIYAESVHLLHQGIKTDAMDEDTANGHAQLAATACFVLGIVVVYALDAVVHWLSPPIHEAATEYDGVEHLARDSLELLLHSPPPPSHDVEAPAAALVPSPAASAVSVSVVYHRPDDPRPEQRKRLESARQRAQLQRMSLLSALALGLHNLPEGVATFVAASQNSSVGFSLAVGIGLHNIPEGIAVAAPIYFATGSRWRGLLWCAISAVAEPVGGALAWLLLGNGLNPVTEGVLFGVICGIMVCISVKELLPTARRFAGDAPAHQRLVTLGVFAGMLVMVASLILFAYAGSE
ncbi:hypothetical protein PINS_up013059 [Pythium insidiosum]|nr:hypothetical protein PINS_up013059 [Pythium insidiosum]